MRDWRIGSQVCIKDGNVDQPNCREVKQANKKHDSIAQQMWDDYIAKEGLNVNA
jgi:hypothetical protein